MSDDAFNDNAVRHILSNASEDDLVDYKRWLSKIFNLS
jgi:hypothetical protein